MLYLLQDAAVGAEAIEVLSDHLPGDITDFLIRKTLDWIHLENTM